MTIDSRKKTIVSDIIRRLHQGLSVEEARQRILHEVGKLTSSEITTIEQSLMDEGVSPDEIRRFCNVHALLFESALEKSMETPEGASHPLALLAAENREIEKVVAALRDASVRGDPEALRGLLGKLAGVERHYELKENALFPFLEKHGFPGPSKVMWSKHNEVRAMLKEALKEAPREARGFGSTDGLEKLLSEIEGMIFKEENILFPAARERISAAEWVEILKACDEIGFAFLKGAGLHASLAEAEQRQGAEERDGAGQSARAGMGTDPGSAGEPGAVRLPSGTLSVQELRAVLDTLPIDITFVDADDRVRYFSQSKDRIFVRATSVLGRDVHNCHPPQSFHKVKRILEDFRSGARDHADFWITMQGKLVFIRYFAVRSATGAYLGALEVTQDLTDIRKISGEKRLLDD
jgi:DUF438 domain-containing protein